MITNAKAEPDEDLLLKGIPRSRELVTAGPYSARAVPQITWVGINMEALVSCEIGIEIGIVQHVEYVVGGNNRAQSRRVGGNPQVRPICHADSWCSAEDACDGVELDGVHRPRAELQIVQCWASMRNSKTD